MVLDFVIKQEIAAYGHENVLGTHKTTIEITRESNLTKNGDCIISVKSNKTYKDFNNSFKRYLKTGKLVKIVIEVNNIKDEIIAYGSPKLKLTDKIAMVIRKSDFIDDRTLVIRSNKAAIDLNRKLVENLKNPNSVVKIKFCGEAEI